MWNKLFKNEQGFTMVLAVLAIMLISILGLSLMTTTANSKKNSQREYVDQSAYYIAEAGLTLAISTIDAKIMAAKNNAETEFFKQKKQNKELDDFYTTQLKNQFNNLNLLEKGIIDDYSEFDLRNTKINIAITKSSDRWSLTIISTGSIDGQKRTVKQVIDINPLTVMNSTPISNETEIESAIKDFDATSKTKIKEKYTINHTDKKITFDAEVELNASNGVNILTGDHFKGWTFLFKGGLNLSGNGIFITSAKIEVQDNLKITGAKLCLLTTDITNDITNASLKVPKEHHSKIEKTDYAVYIQTKDGCKMYKNGANLYEISQPFEINNPL